MNKKIIFAGTPEFAAIALRAIAAAGFDIPLVLTQPDRPKGRGMKAQASPVKDAAAQLGLTVAQPASLRTQEAAELISAQQADVMVVAAYGLILPQNILNIPRHGCLNIHASLLPRWRGAAPIQRAIEAGDTHTGVCIMRMDAGLDTGAIISTHSLPIASTDTAQDVHDALATIGAAAIVADLQHLDQLTATPQPELGVSYAAKLSKAEAKIDWTQPAAVIERKIRAFNPVPGAWTYHQGKPLKIWRARLCDQHGPAGTVLAADGHQWIVACADAALSLELIQPAGSKAMSVAAFLAGNHVLVGSKLDIEETQP